MNRSRGNYIWRAPGNGNIFDTSLEDWKNGRMSRRTITCLKYIKENDNYIKKEDFENQIKKILNEKYKDPINDSNTYSFYSPLIFLGFINDIKNNFNKRYLSLSIDGKNFLDKVENEDFNRAKDCLILQMLKTRYPNTGTKGIILNLFPFRIIFKLLIDKQTLDKKYFETKIPYIKSIEDINNLNIINNIEYNKWTSWELPWMIKLNILSLENNIITISDEKIDYIKQYINDISYEEMFFKTSDEEVKLKNNINKKIKRDNTIIQNAIIRDDFRCFFNKEHITFSTKNKPNFVEGHHIIPISLKDSFNNNLDVENNIISLCPNCHRAIHLSNNEHKEELLTKIYNETNIKNDFNINLENLKEIYYSNLI